MKTENIKIKWSDPIRIEDAIQILTDEIGLYYITRTYHSKEKSLYLGKSDSSIKRRLIDHDKHWVHKYSHSKIYVRIGTITEPKIITPSVISHAESALIYEHGQYGTKILFENTQSTNSYSYDIVYKIYNEGNYFELKPIVDMNDHEEYEFTSRP